MASYQVLIGRGKIVRRTFGGKKNVEDLLIVFSNSNHLPTEIDRISRRKKEKKRSSIFFTSLHQPPLLIMGGRGKFPSCHPSIDAKDLARAELMKDKGKRRWDLSTGCHIVEGVYDKLLASFFFFYTFIIL